MLVYKFQKVELKTVLTVQSQFWKTSTFPLEGEKKNLGENRLNLI